jgi:predicted DNA-binding transcriptional regulator YafY
MKQIQRLQEIHKIIKTKKVSLIEIISRLNEIGIDISIRQLQRDLNDIHPILNNDENLITSRNSKRVKYFFVKGNKRKSYKSTINPNKIRATNFYEAKINPLNNKIIESLSKAIENNFSIIIPNLSYDSTGDNFAFTERNIKFKPVEIIFHRGTHYIGGYNFKKKIIQLFEINQIKKIEPYSEELPNINFIEKLNQELLSRFGISKNINDEIYSIILEFSLVTGNFIMNHFWHETQSFKIQKGKVIMTMNCGINRELMGWLFYWMYNVKIVEPRVLQDYYVKTVEEINLINNNKQPLVYKNIFNNK